MWDVGKECAMQCAALSERRNGDGDGDVISWKEAAFTVSHSVIDRSG